MDLNKYRTIIHIDLDAFFCAVEEKLDPSLSDKPFAVGGRPESRGVVASCSYSARQYGVRSAMSMVKALRLCPGLLIISSHHANYSQVSKEVMDLLNEFTPYVEQISIDEAFLDLSDTFISGMEIAQQIQDKINKELCLPCSLGVATNKLVAKIATEVGKSKIKDWRPPNAITVVPMGEESAFLEHLPVIALWGVGPKTAAKLISMNIYTIGDIARTPEKKLIKDFGKFGHYMAIRSQGIDDTPIITTHETKSISQEFTFVKDIEKDTTLQNTLFTLSQTVAQRLRHQHLCATTVRIKVRWPDFTTISRQTTLSQATDQDTEILAAAKQLFNKVWSKGKKVRLLGVSVSGLGVPLRQLGFWDTSLQKDRRLIETLDDLQSRYGKKIIRRGTFDLKINQD